MPVTKPKPEVKSQKGHSVRQAKRAYGSTRKTSTAKPFQVVKELIRNFDISAIDMASVLDITPKTLSRWKGKGNAMSEQQADRMLVLKSIFDLGRKVLGSDANVKKWIHEPVFSLDGEIPLRLLKTESGRRRVESVLHQIECGFF